LNQCTASRPPTTELDYRASVAQWHAQRRSCRRSRRRSSATTPSTATTGPDFDAALAAARTTVGHPLDAADAEQDVLPTDGQYADVLPFPATAHKTAMRSPAGAPSRAGNLDPGSCSTTPAIFTGPFHLALRCTPGCSPRVGTASAAVPELANCAHELPCADCE
jgi:hypothetical protein